jgi:DNA-binding winged helix-turn-helix (wHTH) protein
VVGASSFLARIHKETTMQQSDINRAVARATNETIATIKRYGFSIEEPPADLDSTDADHETGSEFFAEGASRDLALC